jgi:hypothetical protein
LLKYWGKHPPVHVSVAAYLGIGGESEGPGLPKAGTSENRMIETMADAQEFMACFQAAGGVSI